MTSRITRPEDRCRSGTAEPDLWADTAPACFRSEAFAEDLQAPPARAPRAARWLRRRSGRPAIAPAALSMRGIPRG